MMKRNSHVKLSLENKIRVIKPIKHQAIILIIVI